MITEELIKLAKSTKSKIAIGTGTDLEYISRTTKVAEKANLEQVANVVLVGEIPPKNSTAEFIQTKTPEEMIITLLLDGKVDGIVRGSLSSSKFLTILKKRFVKDVLYRLALLETFEKHQFFFAPVGIDECKNAREKLTFVQEGARLLKKLNIDPKIAILSGGREEDKGRGKDITSSIEEANEVVELAKRNEIHAIKNYNILIEDAIKDKANLIIGPEGIAGNLIYRTLIHLGAGKSHGAIYLGLDKPVIDTSRVGPEFEYYSAIAFAGALKAL